MKKPNHLSAYSRQHIAAIKAKAMKLKKGVISVNHIKPRAYCVAKQMGWAVFVIPPCDNEPQVAHHTSDSIHAMVPGGLRVGDWCSLAYVATQGYGEPMVVEILK